MNIYDIIIKHKTNLTNFTLYFIQTHYKQSKSNLKLINFLPNNQILKQVS